MHALISQAGCVRGIHYDRSFFLVWVKHGDSPVQEIFSAGRPTLPKSIYIAGIEGNAWQFMGNHAMDSVLKITAPVDLQWKTFAYANENHGSVTFKTIYDGLRFIFSDYNNNIGDLIPAKRDNRKRQALRCNPVYQS